MTYTTGELAGLCGVSVRTVQYYDNRGVISPSLFTEGGRRLYTEDDLARMKLICYLRELDLSLNSIVEILKEDHSENVITLILAEQEAILSDEIAEKKEKLSGLNALRELLKKTDCVTPEAIGSVAQMMETKKQLKKMRMTMLVSSIPFGILEVVGIVLWAVNGIWWPFAVYALLGVPWAVFVSRYYFKRVAYICPVCSRVFHPRFKEMFWANHTMKTRKLHCPHCHHKGFCVETYHRRDE